jgi:SPP1 gp7 family putative phage head morphogenesis protein
MIFKSPKSKELEYTKYIRGQVNNIFKNTREIIKKKGKLRFKDELVDDVEQLLKEILTKSFNEAKVNNFVSAYFLSLNILLDKRLQAGLGVTVGLINKELLDLIVSQNVQLISTLHADLLKDIQFIITQSIIEGETIPQITSKIRAVQDKGLFRAETIAITETAKASSQLNRARFKELGIVKARWSTAKDDRVRDCHKNRNGKEYDLSKGLYSGCDDKTLQVGEDFRCRCGMLIVI